MSSSRSSSSSFSSSSSPLASRSPDDGTSSSTPPVRPRVGSSGNATRDDGSRSSSRIPVPVRLRARAGTTRTRPGQLVSSPSGFLEPVPEEPLDDGNIEGADSGKDASSDASLPDTLHETTNAALDSFFGVDDEEDQEQHLEEVVSGLSPSSSLQTSMQGPATALAPTQQQEQQPQQRRGPSGHQSAWGPGHRRKAAVSSFARVGDSSSFGARVNAEEGVRGMMETHARVADESVLGQVADDKATEDVPRVKAAPAATVEVSYESRAKTDPTGGLVARESAADDKVADELQRAVSSVATPPGSQLDSMPGPVRIRTTTAGGQNFGADAAVGTRSRSTTTVAGERPPEATASRPLPPPVPRLDPARLTAMSLSEKRRIKAERAQGCSHGLNSPRTTPDFAPLSLPAVTGLSGSVVEDIPPVPPLPANLSPSVVPAGSRVGLPLYTGRFAARPGPPPPNRPLPPIPGQSTVPLGTQVQAGEVGGDVEYEGDVEESDYEDSDSRESHHGGSRPRLYAPSLSTIRDSSPVPPASSVAVASSMSSSSPGTADRSFIASDDGSFLPRGDYDTGVAQRHREESPAHFRGSDDTTLVAADITFVQSDRRRWGMVPHMLGEEVRLRLASSPTPSSADSERTARPAPGEEQEECVEEAGFAIDNSAIVNDFGESVPSREESPTIPGSLVEDPAHGLTTTLPPLLADLEPLPLRRAPAVRRGSPVITSPRPQPQPARPALYVFPRPPMGLGLRPDGGSSTQRPGAASTSGDGGLVSSVTVGVLPRPPHVAMAMSSGAGSVVSGPGGAIPPGTVSSGVASPGVSSSGAGLGRGLPRSVTQAIPPPPPVPVSSPPRGFARSVTQALPRIGGALGGNSRFGTRAVSAPRPMGAPTGDEDDLDAELRQILSRTRDGYQDQRAVLRPGLRLRTQTLGTFGPSTISGSTPDITSPPTSSGRGSGSRQLSGSSTFVGSPTSPAMMSSPTPMTPGFSSPSFASGSGGRGRGRGRSSRGSGSSARSSQPQPPPQPRPQPQLAVEMRERGPALVTVRDDAEAERSSNEPEEEPRSHWSSDTEDEPSAMGRMRNAFSRLRTKSRGNLRREASSSFSTTTSLSPVSTRDGPPRLPDIPPVPPLPSIPVPPIPTEDDNDAANQAGSQRRKLNKKKSPANLFGKKRED
ncbi:hypothetical protein B0H65DRAFT_423266 [Neurospora tetraspora]|uniref:Uncharacterized protein n=1 Tax=Neurospora tetraspora TaxID=94610 RepID=A0AAE0MTY6_9PEZI|nr:hypothetical protein B0H65DRAFT_423266 [Neurospora tetraspora]